MDVKNKSRLFENIYVHKKPRVRKKLFLLILLQMKIFMTNTIPELTENLSQGIILFHLAKVC